MQCGTNKSAQASKIARMKCKVVSLNIPSVSYSAASLSLKLFCISTERRGDECCFLSGNSRVAINRRQKNCSIASWCICAENWGQSGSMLLTDSSFAKRSLLFCTIWCQTTANMNILIHSQVLHPDPLHTRFFENHVTSCSLTTSVQRHKIKCLCTWKGTNGLKANRRDQMFVSKHTTLWLSLFLLLCPDSFFILFKQLDGKENWLKSNLCFMISSSAERRTA